MEHGGRLLEIHSRERPRHERFSQVARELLERAAEPLALTPGLELTPVTVDVGAADATAVELAVVAEGEEALAQVSGSVTIVNAPGGSVASVVLVPVGVFNTVLERGPVPFGLRAPNPAGTYEALAAFENEFLVRDAKEVEVLYAGPALESGLYYQFRAISVTDDTPISATEDLRGVFVVD